MAYNTSNMGEIKRTILTFVSNQMLHLQFITRTLHKRI